MTIWITEYLVTNAAASRRITVVRGFIICGLMMYSLLGTSHEISQITGSAMREPSWDRVGSWIVAGKVSRHNSGIPSCENLCAMVIRQLISESNYSSCVNNNYVPVGLFPCLGNTEDELWHYNSQSMAIVNSGSNCSLCLDATDPSLLHLAKCNNNAAQMWIVEQNMRIRSAVTDINSTAVRFYIKKGRSYIKNGYTLTLGDASESIGLQNFTWIRYRKPISVLPLGKHMVSVVKNGGFEECGIDPGQGSIVLDETKPFPLCYWHIVKGKVEYWGANQWRAGEGNRALHLNDAYSGISGSVAQILTLVISSNYSLTFLLSGNARYSCRNTTRITLQVLISNSTISALGLWFDVEEIDWPSDLMGWRRSPSIEFTALDQQINLTFSSTTLGSCGPIIDDVRLQKINRPTVPFEADRRALKEGMPPPIGSVHKGNVHRSTKILIIWVTSGIGIILMVIVPIMYCWLTSFRKLKNRQRNAVSASSLNINEGICLKSKQIPAHFLSLLVRRGVQNLSWADIVKATGNFCSVIAEGGFSTVYLARFADQTLAAVKIQSRSQPLLRQAFKRELDALLRARHVNLVNLIGYCEEREEGALVFEYVPNGNLHQKLHSESPRILPWCRRMAIAFQIAGAIEYLHEDCSPPIVHSDIKSPNVLLDEQYNVRLCDFGFSKSCTSSFGIYPPNSMASVVGSPGYLDPEHLKTGIVSKKSDVYSFGVVLLELVTGMEAFCVDREELLTVFASPFLKDPINLCEIVDCKLAGCFDSKEVEAIGTIAALCIHEQPDLRPSMSEIVRIMQKNLSLVPTARFHGEREDNV